MEEIISNRVFCLKNNSGVLGEITQRNKFYINVEILLPYKGWNDERSISGPSRMTPHHYLTERGDEVAQDLLSNSYEKLKRIDKHIDVIVNEYYALQRDIKKLNGIDSPEAKNRLIYKLEDWFWCHRLFYSNQTSLIADHHDRHQLKEIFRIYRLTGMKMFV